MKFPMIVYKSGQSDYCSLLPDFPVIFMAEKSMEDLAAAVQDAVETWMDGEKAEVFPLPGALASVARLMATRGAAFLCLLMWIQTFWV